MIPTWKNISGVSLDLSQRAMEESGDQAQKAFAGLQALAAKETADNVRATEAADADNLLKFQQAARGMSLGEIDALNKAAPEELMQRFGLNRNNIGQALDFSNQQDDAILAEQDKRYTVQEQERQRTENPIRAKLLTAIAKAEASGNTAEAQRLIDENVDTLQDGSDVFQKLNEANKSIQNQEIAKQERNFTLSERQRMLSSREANFQLGKTLESINVGFNNGNTDVFGAIQNAQQILKNNPILLEENPGLAVSIQTGILDSYAKSSTLLTEPAKAIVSNITSKTKEANDRLLQTQQSELEEFKAANPVNTYDSLKTQYGDGTDASKAINDWITNNQDKLSNSLLFGDGKEDSLNNIRNVINKVNLKQKEEGKPALPGYVVAAALSTIPVEAGWTNELPEKEFENQLNTVLSEIDREDTNRQALIALQEKHRQEASEIGNTLNSSLTEVTKAVKENERRLLRGEPQIDLPLYDPLEVMNNGAAAFLTRQDEAKIAQQREQIKNENKTINRPVEQEGPKNTSLGNFGVDTRNMPVNTAQAEITPENKRVLLERLSNNPLFRSSVGKNKPLPTPPEGMTVKSVDKLTKLAQELEKNKTLEGATPQEIGAWLKSDGKGNVSFGSRTQNAVTVGPRWQEFQASGTAQEKEFLLKLLKAGGKA